MRACGGQARARFWRRRRTGIVRGNPGSAYPRDAGGVPGVRDGARRSALIQGMEDEHELDDEFEFGDDDEFEDDDDDEFELEFEVGLPGE